MLTAVFATAIGCDSPEASSSDVVRVGALLPFSGEQAAMGLNIEQAIILAVADINEIGGVMGRPLELVTRDSNSGSSRGYDQAKILLYEKKLKYLIGPEENGLAKQLVSDVKQLDVLNILPGFSAPTIKQSGEKGAWIRLAPAPDDIGCAMAYKALSDGHHTAATFVMPDDYHKRLSAAFNSYFAEFGGHLVGSIALRSGQPSYVSTLDSLYALDPELVLMLAYPTTAAVVTRDWLLSGKKGDWYLAPTLYTDMFLKNVPAEALDDFTVFSPSLSLMSECDMSDSIFPEEMSCDRGNIGRFSDYYSSAWGGDRPLPAALFYYDAVVLLALSLNWAWQQGNENPTPVQLRDYVKIVAEPPGELVRWNQLEDGMKAVKSGNDITYSGAAAEYAFPVTRISTNYGVAEHRVVDAWDIEGEYFELAESIWAYCLGIVIE